MAHTPKAVKKILKQNIRPPASKRFCAYCERMRTFKYDRVICHSVCQRCGSHISYREDPNKNQNEKTRR